MFCRIVISERERANLVVQLARIFHSICSHCIHLLVLSGHQCPNFVLECGEQCVRHETGPPWLMKMTVLGRSLHGMKQTYYRPGCTQRTPPTPTHTHTHTQHVALKYYSVMLVYTYICTIPVLNWCPAFVYVCVCL